MQKILATEHLLVDETHTDRLLRSDHCFKFVVFYPSTIGALKGQPFFNEDVNAAWMKLNQGHLVVVLKGLEATELTTTEEIKLIISALNYSHLMTDHQTWKALQKNISKSSSAELSVDERIYLDELLLKTMLALNRCYLTHLEQHNLLKILNEDLRLRERK